MKLPNHIYANISHNQHKVYYQTVREYLDDVCPLVEEEDFESSEAMQECIDNDEIWMLQLYPKNAVGFWAIAAPTFDELMALASKVDSRL